MMNKLLYVLLVFFIISCSDNGEAKNESTAGNQEPDAALEEILSHGA